MACPLLQGGHSNVAQLRRLIDFKVEALSYCWMFTGIGFCLLVCSEDGSPFFISLPYLVQTLQPNFPRY